MKQSIIPILELQNTSEKKNTLGEDEDVCSSRMLPFKKISFKKCLFVIQSAINVQSHK